MPASRRCWWAPRSRASGTCQCGSRLPSEASAGSRWPEMVGAAPLVCCLPPAGGSVATFRPWLRSTDPGDGVPELQALNVRLIQSQLVQGQLDENQPAQQDPGQPVTLLDLAAAIAGQVPADRPFVLAGHSLGGLLAYEAAVELQRLGGPLPAFVLVMGSRPPHNSSAEVFAPLIDLPDEDFLDALERVGAVNSALRTSPMRPLFLPGLRADLRVITTYRPDTAARRRAPLPVPVVAWSGTHDPLAPPSLLSGWGDYTAFPREVETFEGGHFFPFEEAQACLPALARLCDDLVPPPENNLQEATVSPVANTLPNSGSAT
ncbi:thioesterase II family protein [Arthrobacter sp. MDT3-24]